MTTMPQLPSEWIDRAIDDLEQVEKDNQYVVDFDTWHEPNFNTRDPDDKCHVCFAGSVMAKTFDCDPTLETTPAADKFTKEQRYMLFFLNSIRSYMFYTALADSGIPLVERRYQLACELERVISHRCDGRRAEYHDDPAAFKETMRMFADVFRHNGY